MNVRAQPKRIPNSVIPLKCIKSNWFITRDPKRYDLKPLSFSTCLKTNLFVISDHNNTPSKIEIRTGRSRYPDTWNQNNDCL